MLPKHIRSKNNRSTKTSEKQRKVCQEIIKRERRTKGIIVRIRQDMINNGNHFSDNGNGSIDFPAGQYWAMLLWSIDWNVQNHEAKSNPIRNVREINSPSLLREFNLHVGA